ncbi:uncharacterized protein EV154DRAFT_486303 [Mucor mucedo]|uniref:uncharacterized protein n=1 Tax=Mucor mucedo TaxID=29922 RepID=UPI002220796A|nr:uncharacterized protein EV154DRAFT_486303 [Mucor mucedo]KAI7877550.1 hypothetical protein EV154DRAFT_486303 [Mucor mucedo]
MITNLLEAEVRCVDSLGRSWKVLDTGVVESQHEIPEHSNSRGFVVRGKVQSTWFMTVCMYLKNRQVLVLGIKLPTMPIGEMFNNLLRTRWYLSTSSCFPSEKVWKYQVNINYVVKTYYIILVRALTIFVEKCQISFGEQLCLWKQKKPSMLSMISLDYLSNRILTCW